MTRKDQTTRAWISRESTRHRYLSHVSHKGKVHTLRTPSKLRKAAREFNTLHTIRILSSATPAQQLPLPSQSELQL